MKATIRMFVMAGAVSLAVGGAARATLVNWQPAQTINNDADVRTAGTLVAAYNLGPNVVSGATVNGVTFDPFPIAGPFPYADGIDTEIYGLRGGVSVAPLTPNSAFGSASSPFFGLSPDYKTLLASNGQGQIAGDQIVVWFQHLTDGHEYVFQAWVNDSQASGAGLSEYVVSETIPNTTSGNLTFNSTGLDGGVGQYITCTFTPTANENYQGSGAIAFDITPNSGQQAVLSAFQLRDITVPEPSTLLLLGVGAVLLWWRKQVVMA